MLNQTGISSKSAGTRKTILYDTKLFFALSCVLTGDAGKTYLAGTPISGDLSNRDTAFTVGGDSPVGILEHDVVIKDEETTVNAGVIVFGFIDEDKLDDTVVEMLTDDVKSKLTKITFCK
jgi:hypothetical protein